MTFLITGGAGFIGSNLANHFLSTGEDVIIFDNLSRAGVARNLDWLYATHGDRHLTHLHADIRDADALADAVARADVIYHLAAQVAVTTSVAEPRTDFEVNALGTFNVLEGARLAGHKPILIFTSTNKVYGGMEDVAIVEEQIRYRYCDYPQGIAEDWSLDFHSPYGCSKGAADQYVRDYARIYDLPTVVFRMSCIYGPRQFGTEDQGWVAYFVIASLLGWPITIYGDGKQVRDILFIDDLVRAFDLATEDIQVTAGQAYNIGGGSDNTIAVWREFGEVLRDLIGREIPVSYSDWRPGDQLVYVSDTRKARRDFGWQPQIGKREGIERLLYWVQNNLELFAPPESHLP
ncbi:MAG: NAD-dependent epimerase/dehydratase family protein [Anaerolineales bacterium]|nr:MAG: NAD-dependent epimerase/dehydratase family protein [Anaerolineales bacterium]